MAPFVEMKRPALNTRSFSMALHVRAVYAKVKATMTTSFASRVVDSARALASIRDAAPRRLVPIAEAKARLIARLRAEGKLVE